MTGGNGSDGGNGKSNDAQNVMAHLAESGFFEQFSSLENNLRIIADDLKSLGDAATKRIQETESLAVHILAVESVVLTILKKYPVDAEDIRAMARATTGPTGSEDGNPAVLAVVDDLLVKSERT